MNVNLPMSKCDEILLQDLDLHTQAHTNASRPFVSATCTIDMTLTCLSSTQLSLLYGDNHSIRIDSFIRHHAVGDHGNPFAV